MRFRRHPSLHGLAALAGGGSAAVLAADALDVYDWPDVLGETWLFDQGSAHGFMPVQAEAGRALRGPAPDWALGDPAVPTLELDAALAGPGAAPALGVDAPRSSLAQAAQAGGRMALDATQYPGSIVLNGSKGALGVVAQIVFVSSNLSLAKVALENTGDQESISASVRVIARLAQPSYDPAGNVVVFAMPLAPKDWPCFSAQAFSHGELHLGRSAQGESGEEDIEWSVSVSPEAVTASSTALIVPPRGSAAAYLAISTAAGAGGTPPAVLARAADAEAAVGAAVRRWDAYVSTVLSEVRDDSLDVRWAAVKSVQTLIHNWRTVPGLPDGVLPSYTGYGNGFWSWDTYKQVVGMVLFAPDLAKQQLRLLITTQDARTGHLPDKVDRCGQGGGCSGKPPLLAWAVWQVYTRTADRAFLRDMYPAIEAFHRFWYAHRDVGGVGLCAWTEAMESGMDDGVRFMPEFAKGITNSSSQVTTLDFWSIDLNAYLYLEKRIMARAARELGREAAARAWDAAAAELAPKVREAFYVEDGAGGGFFQDRYMNGSIVPVQGCEGYAALFTEVATLPQARAVARTLRDQRRFFLNFSLPTVSKADPHYQAKGFWRGPTWLDQTWFAYTGLRAYGARGGGAEFDGLAAELKRRVFEVGKGFRRGDTTPLNEHYGADTGDPLGATHFSWTAVHALLWATEGPGEKLPRAAEVMM